MIDAKQRARLKREKRALSRRGRVYARLAEPRPETVAIVLRMIEIEAELG